MQIDLFMPRARDVYDRLVADVFVSDQNVAEILMQEGYALCL